MNAAKERFTELYERHHGDVWRYVARRLAASDVGDVVAEVFLVAWRRLDKDRRPPRTGPRSFVR